MMRAARSGIAIGLALALLVPGAVVGQEAEGVALSLEDATGDLHDLSTGEPTDGPAYTDITGLEVSSEGNELTVRFDVAQPVEAPDPRLTSVIYYLNIDTDGDGFQNRYVAIRSEDRWVVEVYDWDADQHTFIGDAVVADGSLSVSLPVSRAGLTPDARVHGLMQATNSPDPVDDPLNTIEWEDRVPDDEEAWLALGELSWELSPWSSIGTCRTCAIRSTPVFSKKTGSSRPFRKPIFPFSVSSNACTPMAFRFG